MSQAGSLASKGLPIMTSQWLGIIPRLCVICSCPSCSRRTYSASVWPDLAKFCNFGKSLQVFGKFLIVYFLFVKMLSLLWQTCYIIGLIFIVANGQILKNNLTHLSHCAQPITWECKRGVVCKLEWDEQLKIILNLCHGEKWGKIRRKLD